MFTYKRNICNFEDLEVICTIKYKETFTTPSLTVLLNLYDITSKIETRQQTDETSHLQSRQINWFLFSASSVCPSANLGFLGKWTQSLYNTIYAIFVGSA